VSPTSTDDGELIERAIGTAIRAARVAASLSMTALAERCGISQPYLSQLENGKGSPSINTLYKLANALGVSPQDLLPDDGDEMVVIRHGSRPATPIEERADAALARVLLGAPDHLLQVQEVSVDPDQHLGGFFDHEGEEFLYVLEGQITVEVGSRPSTALDPGDSVWYAATLPHRWKRIGEGPARILVVSATVPGRRAHR
jgi:transcriptional regulator with XRE-family HTH domain